MEITKINEMISPRVLKKFEAKIIKASDLKIEPNAVNVVNFVFSKNKKNYFNFSGFFSDSVTSIFELQSNIEFIKTYNLITNDFKENIDQNLIIFKEVDETQFYVVTQKNTTYSPEEPNNKIDVLIVKEIETFSEEKNINIFFVDKIPSIKINPNFLISEISEINNNFFKPYKFKLVNDNNEYSNYSLFKNVVNLININKEEINVYLSTLDDFNNIPLDDFIIEDRNAYIKSGIFFIPELFNITRKYKKILNGDFGKTEEEIKKFKEKNFYWNDPEKFLDFNLDYLKHLSRNDVSEETILTFYKMCSGYLKTRWCIDGGLTNNHKMLLPFYVENIGDVFYLKSAYFDITNKKNKVNWKIKKDFKYKHYFKNFNTPSESNIDINKDKISEDNFKYLFNIVIPDDVDIRNILTKQKTRKRWTFDKEGFVETIETDDDQNYYFLEELKKHNFVLDSNFSKYYHSFINHKWKMEFNFVNTNTYIIKGVFIPKEIILDEQKINIFKTYDNFNITNLILNYIN